MRYNNYSMNRVLKMKKKTSILNLSLILIKVLLCAKRQHNISLTLACLHFITVLYTVLLPKKVWRHYDDVTHSQNGSC